MDSNAHVELVLAAVLDHVLVGTDAACLQGLTRQLLILVRYQVNGARERADIGLLGAQVIDPDLGVYTQTTSLLNLHLFLLTSRLNTFSVIVKGVPNGILHFFLLLCRFIIVSLSHLNALCRGERKGLVKLNTRVCVALLAITQLLLLQARNEG